MDGNDSNIGAIPDESVPNARTCLERVRSERSGWTGLVGRLWKRHVTERPDRYRTYVFFPTEPDCPPIESIRGRIEELERVFEGRLDVYARVRGLSVVTDSVPARGIDADALATVLERIEADYDRTHRLAQLEKWRTLDGHLVKSIVAVPVKPLFP